jgi:hypothetical protein
VHEKHKTDTNAYEQEAQRLFVQLFIKMTYHKTLLNID